MELGLGFERVEEEEDGGGGDLAGFRRRRDGGLKGGREVKLLFCP